MNAPAPKTTTAPDEALGSLMGAALDVPNAPEQPEVPAWAPDNTLARTGNTEKEQAMWFGGMEQAQVNAQDNAAIRGGADWLPIESAPQTGRTLLLGYWNSLGKWRTVRGQWMSLDHIAENWEEPDDAEAGWFETAVEADDVPNCWRIEPTHWMPLPAAPGTPTSPVSTVEQGQALPPLDENLRLILGRPNFACGQLAQMLRLGGQEIECRAEHEQAAVIYFLLNIYLKHGSGWAEKASDAFAAIAAQQGKGGAA